VNDAIHAIDDQLRKHEGDDNSVDASYRNEARGAQIVQVNTLSTPVVIVILAVLTLVGMLAASSAVFSYMAERNVKLAQYQIEETLKRNHLEVPHE
jgi:hypothetical protein